MSDLHALIVIGEPGAGKTTLVEALTADLAYEESDSPLPFRRYDCGVLELGKRREGGFSGTDALAMSIQPVATQFVEGLRPRLLLFEGDRLANDKFFRALQLAGYTMHIYQLWGSAAAERQRAARGSNQNATWLKGRQTKVMALRKSWGGTILPAGNPVEDLVQRLNDPVSLTLREAKEAIPA